MYRKDEKPKGPHLNEYQKLSRFEACSLLLRNHNDAFLNRIRTCDEKWILYDNRRRSGQWLDADEPSRYFPKTKTHQKRLLLLYGGQVSKPSETRQREESKKVEDLVKIIREIYEESTSKIGEKSKKKWSSPFGGRRKYTHL
ncbi:hypothetical protein RI129_003522 [Pyrocoelia pectoralis]|uniref:Uncharacterized protein n=1 Tax=Pyrocoelia pectoralis TaxID=417401 RepID=A0AAN7VIE0_9COLE